jgi:aminodeoxyfutalosine deaminase
MRDAGLLVRINTDDPAMEDLDLGREYRRVAAAYAWGAAGMGKLALDRIESTWLETPARAALTWEFEAILAGT